MRSIVAFENTPQGYADLYHIVLIDTPVGKYFAEYFKQQSQNKVSIIFSVEWCRSEIYTGRDVNGNIGIIDNELVLGRFQ